MNARDIHRASDLIAADRYAAGKAAATKATRGLRITKLIPDGTA